MYDMQSGPLDDKMDELFLLVGIGIYVCLMAASMGFFIWDCWQGTERVPWVLSFGLLVMVWFSPTIYFIAWLWQKWEDHANAG